jgi:CDP-diacylglycerol--glycerol-3-phosphate 3-phosphatidyltransferase
MTMNLPNILTLSRLIISPVFMALLLVDNVYSRLGALALFILASITDLLDGYLARKNGQQTDFGKFMDPVADKFLIALALISFVAMKSASTWMVMVIIGREFLIMGLRTLVAYRREVMESSFLAKIKTFSQMTAVFAILLHICLNDCVDAGLISISWQFLADLKFSFDALLFLAMLLTLLSGVDYVIKNRWLILGLFKGNM